MSGHKFCKKNRGGMRWGEQGEVRAGQEAQSGLE